LHADSRSPPCAPTPGARIHTSGPAAFRAADKAWGSVAPTTRPSFGGGDDEDVILLSDEEDDETAF